MEPDFCDKSINLGKSFVLPEFNFLICNYGHRYQFLSTLIAGSKV